MFAGSLRFLFFLFLCLQAARSAAQHIDPNARPYLEKARENGLRNLNSQPKGTFFRHIFSQLNSWPQDIPYVSGILIPGSDDAGIHYILEEELILTPLGNELQEQVLARRERGRFNDLFWETGREMARMPQADEWRFSEFSDLQVLMPTAHPEQYIWDYVGNQTGGRLYFTPQKLRRPLFHGYLEIDSAGRWQRWKGTIYGEQHIRMLDSLTVDIRLDGHMMPVEWEYKFHYNLTLYRGVAGARLVRTDSSRSALPYPGLVYVLPEGADTTPLTTGRITAAGLREDEANIQTSREQVVGRTMEVIISDLIRQNGPFRLYLPALWRAYGYNTVEGNYLVYRPAFQLQTGNSRWNLLPYLRSAFDEDRFRYGASLQYSPLNRPPETWRLAAGTDLVHFNEETPIYPLYNTLYTLFLAKNLAKFYQKEFVAADWTRETLSGWKWKVGAEWVRRLPEQDLPYFSLLPNSSWEFTPNLPPPVHGLPGDLVHEHRALVAEAGLEYRWGVKYGRFRKEIKALPGLDSRLGISYRRGLNLGKEYSVFDRVELNWQWFLTTFRGLTLTDLRVGTFFNQPEFFADYKHFNGVQTVFLQRDVQSNSIRQFRTMPYYDFSTTSSWVELHLEHDFQGNLLGRLGGFNRLQWQLVTGTNVLIREDRTFAEIFLGVDNVFRVLRLEMAVPLTRADRLLNGFRVGISVNYLFYKKHLRR